MARTAQLASVQYGSLANVNLRKLTYAQICSTTSVSSHLIPAGPAYSYDALQGLIAAARIGAETGTVNYVYDAVGNPRDHPATAHYDNWSMTVT